VGTGACGIRCDVCRLKVRGLCGTCGAGTGAAGKEKLAAQTRIFHGTCPVLQCAHDHGVAYCPRDCRSFPCRVFEQGPYPYSEGFLAMQKRRRAEPRAPSLDLDRMLRWEQEEIFPGFWEDLAALDPREVSERTGAPHLEEEGAYAVRLLDRTYRVHPLKHLVVPEGTSPGLDFTCPRVSFTEALILVVYLLKARAVPPTGRRVTEKELPGGGLFFRGPHELARGPVLSRFGEDPAGFLRTGLALGGETVSFGDAGLRFQVLPRVPLECILWAADHEFPASLTFVFDASVSEHLPLDVIWALVALVSGRLAERRPL